MWRAFPITKKRITALCRYGPAGIALSLGIGLTPGQEGVQNAASATELYNPAPEDASQSADAAALRFGTSDVAVTIESILDLSPQMRDFLTEKPDALPNAKAALAQIRAELDQTLTPDFIARVNDTSDRRIRRIAQRAERFARRDANLIMRADIERMQQGTRRGTVLGRYANILFAAERLRYLQRIYPESAIIAEANRQVAPRVAGLGSFADVERTVEANEEAAAASRRVRPSRQSDAALARRFGSLFAVSNFTQSNFGNLEVLRTNLIDTGWTVERNAVTGIIISRYQRASIGFRAQDGKCHVAEALFEQRAASGGRYSSAYLRSHRVARMLCENI